MPADTNATDFATHTARPSGRGEGLPAGAGLAMAVIAGTVIWGGLLAMFLI